MRILLAGRIGRPGSNGPSAFTYNLARGLAVEGHEVMLLLPSDRSRPFRTVRDGVRIEAVRSLRLAPLAPEVHIAPWSGRSVDCIVAGFRPGVVHIQDHYFLSRSALAAAQRRGLPVVVTPHFLPENTLAARPLASRLLAAAAGSAARRLLWRMALAVYNQATVAAASSQAAASILAGHGLRAPLHAISCGVNLERFHPGASRAEREAMRRRYGIDPRAPMFLYVGRLDRDKDVQVLLYALHMLLTAGQNRAHLAIAGQGHDQPRLAALTQDLGLCGQVAFTGFVADADLPALYAAADVFVMPGQAELLSMATLEAMASGRPVLAARAGALPELVAPGVNGYLFEPGNAQDAAGGMARLLAEPERWPGLGAAGRERARGHDLRATIAGYEALYDRLAKEEAYVGPPAGRRPLCPEARAEKERAEAPRRPAGLPRR